MDLARDGMTMTHKQTRRAAGEAIAKHFGHTGASDAVLEHLGDHHLYADTSATQVLQWLRSALELGELVGSGAGSPSDAAVFWIRFHGVVEDLHRGWSQDLASATEALGAGHWTTGALQELVAAVDAVAMTLPDDDLVYALYRRHVECHPEQHGFRTHLHKKSQTIEPLTFGRLKGRDQADVEDALGRVIRRHGRGGEPRLAIETAARVVAPLRRVIELATPFLTRRDWNT